MSFDTKRGRRNVILLTLALGVVYLAVDTFVWSSTSEIQDANEPHDAIAIMTKGLNVIAETGDLRQGIPYIERSLRLEPSNVDVLRTAAIVSNDLGRVDDAVLLLRQAIIREPLCIPCYTMLGRFLAQDHRWVEAEEVLRARLAIDDKDVAAHMNLSFVLIETGRADEALDIIDEWEPNEAFRLGFRSIALDELGRSDEADDNIAQMRNQFGDNPFLLASFFGRRVDEVQTLYWIGVAMDEDPGAWSFIFRDRMYEFLHKTPQWQQWVGDSSYGQQHLDAIEFEIPAFGDI